MMKTAEERQFPSPIAIVGGGITGLIAGYRLMRLGFRVTIYEASERVGGVIRSVREDGYLAEFGPNSILETTLAFRDLFNELGLANRLLTSRPQAENRYLVRYGRPIALPLSPFRFFATKLFTWRAKLALLREPFVPVRRDGADESVEEFVLRRLNREWLDFAINPLVAGIYAGDPARLSVRYGFPRLYEVEQRYGSLILGQILGAKERRKKGEIPKYEARKLSFDDGLEVLPRRLAELLGTRIRLLCKVEKIVQDRVGWRIIATTPNGIDQSHYAAVLFTVPTYALAEIELEVDRSQNEQLSFEELARVYYPPVATVVLGFRRSDVEHPLDGFGMLVPQKEGLRILGTLFSSTLFEGRAPDGHVTLTTYIGGSRQPELAVEPPDRLIRWTIEDLRVLLGVKGWPTFEHYALYPKAIPQYEVGYGRFLALLDSIERRLPGLFFAGHYRDGISLSDSIRSGIGVAERIRRFVSGLSVDEQLQIKG